MARRPSRVRCDIVANVLVAFALSVAACTADDVASGHVQTGTGGSGADGGAGGGGGGLGGSISCNPVGPACLCELDSPQAGQLTTCSPTSVAANDMQRGVCCLTQSLCICTPYTCRSNPASSYCQCGSVSALAPVTLGSPVAECPTPSAQQKCCFSPDNDSCTCALLPCAAEETEVPNCSATAAGACNSGEELDTCR
jgi:hypothetical protein